MSEQIDLKSIGARIRELRGRDSRSKFSEGFLVPASSLARWEDGGSQPDLDFLIRLSAGFGVPLSWIITGKDGSSDEDSDTQLGYLKNMDWAPKTGDVTSAKQQHTEITTPEKNKTGDVASFDEIIELNRELRQALREIADLRVERERLLHRVAALEQEAAASKNGVLPFIAAPGALDVPDSSRANDADSRQPAPKASASTPIVHR